MPKNASSDRPDAAPGDSPAPRKRTSRRSSGAATATAPETAAPADADAGAEAPKAPVKRRRRKAAEAGGASEAAPATSETTSAAETPDETPDASATPPAEASEPTEKPARRRRRRSRSGGSDSDRRTPPDEPSDETEPTAPPSTPAEPGAADAAGENGDGDRPRRKRKRRRRRRGRGDGGEGGPSSGGDATTSEPIELEACEGVVEIEGPEPRLRRFDNGLVREDRDPVVPRSLVDRLKLRPLQAVRGTAGRVRGGKRPIVSEIAEVEGLSPEAFLARPTYAELTPLDPSPRMSLEFRGCPPANRLIDLFCPIGFGTRGLIVAPPKAGKTILLKEIAAGIKHNHPEVELIALLIDERPEEVTDFRRTVPATVLASSNDQEIERHLDLGIAAIERAKRIVETGRDVVVLLDSLTRLGRAFNNSRRFGSGGRTMSGGLDSRALEVPKQLFGAARKAEEGGSLTIIASCLVDTGSRADQIIFEEFKGTGNMELVLDRSISEKRVFPAINLAASGTRKEHLLMTERELKTITALRRRLLNLPPAVQIEQLLNALKRFETNERLVAG